MKTLFEIEYHTVFGQDLWLNVVEPDGRHVPHAMSTSDGIIWSVELDVEKPIQYYYYSPVGVWYL